VFGSTRCKPSSRMSRTTNESAAFADIVDALKPTRVNALTQRDNKIFTFIQSERKEIHADTKTAAT
jgi:hypothetical protein